jgi:putative zinc finger/helix-turn-helix YgiT family protein
MTAPAAVACPVCGANELELARERRQVTADDGTSLEFGDEFTRCRKCGVDHYTRDQSLASSRARASVLRAHEGLLSPQEIRAIRDRMGYTQAQLEQVLGVGRKTVVRWENGTVRQSRLADRFLRTLAAHPNIVVYDAAGFASVNTIATGAAMQTAHGYVNAVAHAAGYVHANVLPKGVYVYTSTNMFIPGGALQTQVLGAVQVNRAIEKEETWELDLVAANSALAEAA